jgi:putative flippase GtrA
VIDDAPRAREPGRLRAFAQGSAVRYLVAGGAAFLVDLGLLALLRNVVGWPTWLAAAIAFLLSFAFTYTIQRYFTFGSRAPHGVAILKYAALVAFNTLATAAIVALIDATAAGWIAGKVVATVSTSVWNYFIYRYWVFATRDSG